MRVPSNCQTVTAPLQGNYGVDRQTSDITVNTGVFVGPVRYFAEFAELVYSPANFQGSILQADELCSSCVPRQTTARSSVQSPELCAGAS